MEDDYRIIVQKLSSIEKIRKNLVWKHILKGEKHPPPPRDIDQLEQLETLAKKNAHSRFKSIMGILSAKKPPLDKPQPRTPSSHTHLRNQTSQSPNRRQPPDDLQS